MSRHYEIADLLADYFKDVDPQLSKEERYRVIFKGIFLNFRMKKGQPAGLYLTCTGFDLLKNKARVYDIPMHEDYKITMGDKISLDSMCTLPYYFEVKDKAIVLYVFEGELATVLKLNDGNIIQAQEMLYGEKKFLKQG